MCELAGFTLEPAFFSLRQGLVLTVSVLLFHPVESLLKYLLIKDDGVDPDL
jgi:hypothetical protein